MIRRGMWIALVLVLTVLAASFVHAGGPDPGTDPTPQDCNISWQNPYCTD